MGRPRPVPIAAMLAALLWTAGAAGEEPAPLGGAEVTTAACDAALERALRYLDDAIWKDAPNAAQRNYVLATTGWADLLAADKVKGRDRMPARGKQLERIRGALAQYAARVAAHYERADAKREGRKGRRRPDPAPDGEPPPGMAGGMPAMPGGMGPLETIQFVWPLSMAGHFFAESEAHGKRRDVKEALGHVVRVLEAAQQESGGWGHDDAARPGMGLPPIQIPRPPGIEGFPDTYPATLLAASNCALSALAASKRALGAKPGTSVERARKYYEQCQGVNGTFPYDPSQDYGRKASPAASPVFAIDTARTGGAVFALHLAGVPPEDALLAKAVAAIDAHVEWLSESHGSASMGLQLGALAMRLRGDEAWARFRRAHFARMLAAQEEDGAFHCAAQKTSPGTTCDTELHGLADMPGMGTYAATQRVYVTAIYALILALDRTTPRALPPLEAPKTPVTTGR